VELQSQVATMAKRGRAGFAVGERLTAGRHAELLVMPMEPGAGRDPVDALGQLEPADLRLGRGRHLTTQRDRQRLAAEAHPQHRDLRGHRVAQQLDLS